MTSKVLQVQNSGLVKIKIVTSGEFSNFGITFKMDQLAIDSLQHVNVVIIYWHGQVQTMFDSIEWRSSLTILSFDIQQKLVPIFKGKIPTQSRQNERLYNLVQL